MCGVRPGIIAVSRDLMENHGFIPGSKVWVSGYGVMTVGDLMHPRKKMHIDIWQPKDKALFKETGVLATVILDGIGSS